MSTPRTLFFFSTSVLLLFTIFYYFTPLSHHVSSPILAKALSFFEEPSDDEVNYQKIQTRQLLPKLRQVFATEPEETPMQIKLMDEQEPAVDGDKDVVVLTGKNFSDFVTGHGYVMVQFYAPWCYWSQKLAPEYRAAATLLKGEAVLAKVDADQEKALAKQMNIQGYPTLLLLVEGVVKDRYYQERTRDAIAGWVRDKMEPNITDDKEKGSQQLDEPVVTDFVDHERTLLPVKEPNVSDEQEDSLVLDKPMTNIVNYHENNPGPEKLVVKVFFDEEELEERSQPDKEVVNVLNDSGESSLPDIQSLNIFNDHEGSLLPRPPVVISFNDNDESLWQNKAMDEKEDVVVLTKNNFSDFISRNQYVLLNFYAPWCYWSNRLAPEYAAAAAMLKGEVVLAKVNCVEEAELASEYKIQGYPTMFLLVGGVQRVLYDSSNGRSRGAITGWARQIRSHAVLNGNGESLLPDIRSLNIYDDNERSLWPRPPVVISFNDNEEGLWQNKAMDEEDVVVLSKNNFSDFVARNQYVMLNFYAPWCHWSNRLAPEYAAAAAMLKVEVVLAKINCVEEAELEREYKIQEYPTMILLVGGVQRVLYDSSDGRSRGAITAWVRQIRSHAVQNIATKEEASHILTDRSMIVLGFLNTLEGLDNEELTAAAKQHVDVNFYQTANVDIANFFHIDPQTKRPCLVMLKREAFNTSHSHFSYDGQFRRSAIADFVSILKLPSVLTFRVEDASSIFENSITKQLWLFSPKYSLEELCAFKDAAKAFRGKLLFVHVETGYKSVGSRLSFEFGVLEDTPRVVAYMASTNAKYIYHGELTSSSIKSFAKEFLEGMFPRRSLPFSKNFIGLPSHAHIFDPTSIPHVH